MSEGKPQSDSDVSRVAERETLDSLEQHRGALVRFFARRIGDTAESNDLVQEVFLRLVRRGSLAELENLEGYVFRTAESVLLDRGRHRKSRRDDKHIQFEPEVHSAHVPSVEAMVSARQELSLLGDALSELPERTQAIFLLRRVDGCSMTEISFRLGVSLSTVEKQMRDALLHLLARSRDRA